MKKLVVINIILTVLLVIIGSLSHTNASGLECLQWPICYQIKSVASSNFFGTSYAVIHRLFAGLVILLNLFLFMKDSNNKAFRIGLFLLVLQSLLGGLSVVYQFPTIMSTAHLFLSIAYILIFSNSLYEFKIDEDGNNYSTIRDFSALLILLIFIQIFLGAIINHTQASLECSSKLFVSFRCFEFEQLTWWPVKLAGKIHMLHRFNAILISLLAGLMFVWIVFKKIAKLYKPAFLILIVIAFQVSSARSILLSIFDKSNQGAQAFHLVFAIILLTIVFYVYKFLTHEKNIQHTYLSDLLELTKPRLGSLVVVTIFSGVLISAEFLDFFYLINSLFLTTLIVASATTLNCYLEKDIDGLMERTKSRALPSGRLSSKTALIQGIVLIVISIPLTGIYVNWSTAILGLIAFVFYIFIYTPMKQKSPFALYVGAIPGAIPPVMGRTIVAGYIDPLAWILFGVLFVWQLPHFMAISIYHNDDYLSGGIKVYSHFWKEKFLKLTIFLLTIVLVVISLIPYHLDLMGSAYCYASSALGLMFIGLSAFGFFTKSKDQYILWARQYFWGSIIYLPLLMAAMIFFS